MEHGEKEYRLLKSAYAFLNRQISLYEKKVERKVAEYNLLREIGNYTKISEIQNIFQSSCRVFIWN